MKEINLTKSEDLKKLQKEMNSIFEGRIANAEIKETLAEIDSLPFGTLVNIFESVSDKLYETESGKKVIKKYIKLLKENKNLNSKYIITESIMHPENISNPELFLREAISFSNKNANNDKKKLSKIIKFAICESQITKDNLLNIIEKDRAINESLEYIFNNKKVAKNLSDYVSNFSAVCEHIEKNNAEIVTESTKESPKDLMKNLHESLKNNGLESWENKVASDIALCNLSNGNKKELFENYKKDCISSLDNIMESCGVEDKARFSTMKSQLEGKEFNEETLSEDLLKLAKLSHTISE